MEVRRTSENSTSRTLVNKGKKRKDRGLTLRPFGDDPHIALGPDP